MTEDNVALTAASQPVNDNQGTTNQVTTGDTGEKNPAENEVQPQPVATGTVANTATVSQSPADPAPVTDESIKENAGEKPDNEPVNVLVNEVIHATVTGENSENSPVGNPQRGRKNRGPVTTETNAAALEVKQQIRRLRGRVASAATISELEHRYQRRIR